MRAFLSVAVLLACGCAHRGPTAADETRDVSIAALGFMLNRSASKSAQAELSAFVVPKEYARYFPKLKPPVIANDEKRFSLETGIAVDRVTGGHVMIWSVSQVEIHGDTAACYVMWELGSRAAGGHTVHLRKRGTWMAESEESLWIAQKKPNKAPEPTPTSVTPPANSG